MRTLTLKQNVIESLDSDEKKLEFANSIIGLLSDSKTTTGSKHDKILIHGLNTDIPEPMQGAPDFDSKNMSAPEFKRYSLVRAGFVPAKVNGLIGPLDCPYSDYEYSHLSTLPEFKFDYIKRLVKIKITESKGKRDYLKFLKYLDEVFSWYFTKFIFPNSI